MGLLCQTKRALIAAGLCAVLVAAGCGGDSGDEKVSAPATGAQSPESSDAGAGVPQETPTDPAAPAETGTDAAPATPAPGAATAAPGGAATPAKPSAGKAKATESRTGGAAGSSSAAPGATEKGSKPAAAVAPAPTPGGGPAPAVPAPGAGGPKSEIVLGAVGVHTGVIGDILAPIEHGARAWGADINARGGLNGHPVRIIIADDGGDPGKAVSIGRKLIEQDKIVAFYAEQAPGTLQVYIKLAEKAGIPIFGACSCNPDAAESPNMFSATLGAFQGMNWSHTMMAFKSGKKKLSIFYCREVAICSKGAETIEKKLAPSLGLDVVHTANVSMAAPDYTAEMLAAKNAGAEVIVTYVENPTTLRIIRSGKRQGYTPLISSQMSAHDERIFKHGKEDAEGVMIGASMFHWENPKMADFKAAMGKYVPNGILASFSMNSWVNGKFLEILSKSWPDQGVTGKDVLTSLFAVRGETVGGLVPPLTFREGQGNDRANLCAYPTVIKDGKWVQEENYFCQPDWQPQTK